MAHGLVQADSCSNHRTVGLCRRLVYYDGEVKARQEHQQGSRCLHAGLDLDGNSDQLCLVDSWAVEITQSTLQKCMWPVGW